MNLRASASSAMRYDLGLDDALLAGDDVLQRMVEFERDEQREDLAEHRLERPVVERVEHAQEQPRDHRCREPVQRHQDNERDERRQDQRHRAFEALVVRLHRPVGASAPPSLAHSHRSSPSGFKLLVGLRREARRADRKEDEVGAAGVRDALPGCGRDAHHVPRGDRAGLSSSM